MSWTPAAFRRKQERHNANARQTSTSAENTQPANNISQTPEQLLEKARVVIADADKQIVPILAKYTPKPKTICTTINASEHKKISITDGTSRVTCFETARGDHGADFTSQNNSVETALKPWPIKILLPMTSFMDFDGKDRGEVTQDLTALAKALSQRMDGATMVYKAKKDQGNNDSFVETQHNIAIERAVGFCPPIIATEEIADSIHRFIRHVYKYAIMPVSVNSQNQALNPLPHLNDTRPHDMIKRAKDLGLTP